MDDARGAGSLGWRTRRAGDDLMPNEREFRYGVPLDKADLYNVGDGVAYRWLYR